MSSVRNASPKPCDLELQSALAVGVPAAVTSTRLARPTAGAAFDATSVERLARARDQRLAVGESPRTTSPIATASSVLDAPTGVDEFLRAGEPDRPGKPHGAAEAGDETEPHLGLTEARGIRRVDEIAGERELEASAEREPVDARDDRCRQPFDGRGRAVTERVRTPRPPRA